MPRPLPSQFTLANEDRPACSAVAASVPFVQLQSAAFATFIAFAGLGCGATDEVNTLDSHYFTARKFRHRQHVPDLLKLFNTALQ